MTRYELMERIGVGAMAEIFRGKAVAAGGFEKPVAIKRILPHLGQDRRFVEALIAEAKILSQLRHRNIVQIFDVGLGDDGQYFLVMEYVDGMNLGDVQTALEGRRKRLPLDLALHVGAEVCEALEHAHTALAPDGKPMRLVHRDVAPSNVLVSRHGEVKLTDFGLARRPEDVTSGGGVRGKLGYIAPEAASGSPLDLRSDVFSAAVCVYELALGRRLFSHLSDLDAVRAVYECNVPRPRDVDPGLPPELDAVLMAALVKDPARRTPSAAKLGGALRSLRYSLDTAAGDPAQELARVVLGVEAAADQPRGEPPTDARKAAGRRRNPGPTPGGTSPGRGFGGEPTLISLTSLDPFGDDPGTGLIRALEVLDKFEEEETRLGSNPGIGGGRWREATGPTGLVLATHPDDDASTRVLSPAQLARRAAAPPVADDDATHMVQPKKLAPSAPPPLPGLSRKPASIPPPTPSSPPPVPPARDARGTGPRDIPRELAPMRIEAQVPSRTATPTVNEPPGARPLPRKTSIPPVAGFDPPRPRRWLLVAAIALTLIVVGIVLVILT